jgi:hypothetical protein
VTPVAEAASESDVRQGQFGIRQQFLGALHPAIEKPPMGWNSGRLTKGASQVAHRQATFSRDVVKGNLHAQILAQCFGPPQLPGREAAASAGGLFAEQVLAPQIVPERIDLLKRAAELRIGGSKLFRALFDLPFQLPRNARLFGLELRVLQADHSEDLSRDPEGAAGQLCPTIDVGIEITPVAADSNAEQRALMFMPTALASGIEAADPMIAARSSAYPVSYSRRHQ